MKRPKILRYVSSFGALVAVAFILAGCVPTAESVSKTQSTSVALTSTQATVPATTTAASPTTAALSHQTRVVLAEMFTSEG